MDKNKVCPAITCPKCGYVIKELSDLRCPRCYASLVPALSCSGNCRSCASKKK